MPETPNENSQISALTDTNGPKKQKFVVAKSEGMVASVMDWLKYLITAFVIVAVVFTFFCRFVNVEGDSMYSTLHNGDLVLLSNFNYTPQDRDIVVISHGAEYSEPIIKRVIATEGQTLQLDFENNRIIVDGIVYDEPYINKTTFGGRSTDYEIPEVIPEGKVFVMGDNREVSLDSRSSKIGLIDVECIIGKAQVVLFPFGDFGYLY